MPLISVVIPVHGVEDYLDRCLNTVLNNSGLSEPAVPIEVIAVDDASPDRCRAILAARQDARLRVIRTPAAVTARDTIQVQVDLSNEGAHTACETVFVFTHDVVASVSPPLLQLAGFARLQLAPGRRGTVTIAVPAERLQFLGQDLQPVFEAGAVEILVGPRADRAELLVGTVQLQAGRESG